MKSEREDKVENTIECCNATLSPLNAKRLTDKHTNNTISRCYCAAPESSSYTATKLMSRERMLGVVQHLFIYISYFRFCPLFSGLPSVGSIIFVNVFIDLTVNSSVLEVGYIGLIIVWKYSRGIT